MFQVFIEPLIQECEEMEGDLRLLWRQRDEAEAVIRRLGALSGMDGPVGRCRRENEKLEEEMNGFEKYLQCLGKSVLLYRETERQISEDGENGIRKFKSFSVGMVQVNTEGMDSLDIQLFR